jgi:glutathione S-transferase
MTSRKPQLIGIGFSPWTEKARWALKHHALPYSYHEHLIIFGMPELRWRLGRWTGPLTVPALRDGDQVLMDSWDIAQYAERNGQGSALFPKENSERIEHYNALSEKALSAARALVASRLLRSPEAKAEVLPSFVPGPLRPALSLLASLGVSYIRSEFEISGETDAQALSDLREVWSGLARDLKSSGGDYLLGGSLSYADIAMAVTLQALEPTARTPVGPAYRKCWASPELRDEFSGLLDWRDRLYQRHRPVSA